MSIWVFAAVMLACLVAFLMLKWGGKYDEETDETDSAPADLGELCERLRAEVNTVLNSDISAMGLNKAETERRLRQQAKLRRTTRDACLGDAGDREYLKDYIKEILQVKLGIKESNICTYIRFDRPEHMSALECFEYMYMIYGRVFGLHPLSQLFSEFGFDLPSYDEDGREIYRVTENDVREAYAICPYTGDYLDRLETLTQRCYEKLYGHDAADIFIMDADVDGVSGGVGGRTRIEYNYMEELLNGGSFYRAPNAYEVIYIVYKGRSIRMCFLSFEKELTLERVVKNIYRYNTKVALSKKNPVLQATFKNGSRVVVTRPPVSDSWAFFVRKFGSTNAKNIESLITDDNSDAVIALLKKMVRAELNFVVSGNTGGGKTTLVKSLIEFINPAYALRIIETSFELNINNLYPDRNVHVMQERGDFSIYDAIAASKKMDTDVLILGEVNEPKVAGAFIQVAQSGSKMAITTLHHETTQKLIEYLRNALISEFGITNAAIAEKQVVDSINFDIHMVHDVSGHHYIERITQIVNVEEPAFSGDSDNATREFYRQMTVQKRYELRDIVRFDKDNRCYCFENEVVGEAARRMEAL